MAYRGTVNKRLLLLQTSACITVIGAVAFAHGTAVAVAETLRANESYLGREAKEISSNSPRAVSADGRYVAFDSYARKLVPGDRNFFSDIFVRDMKTGKVTWASVTESGGSPNGGSDFASISANGRYVAFDSEASDLTSYDRNGYRDIFIRDLETQTTKRVLGYAGREPNNFSMNPQISADGRFVAFESFATNFARRVGSIRSKQLNVFIHDNLTGKTSLVSTMYGTSIEPSGSSFSASISGDGGYVSFVSSSEDIVQGDSNAADDVFVHDAEKKRTDLVSVSSGGAQANQDSLEHSISLDGRYVSFASYADNLVENDSNLTKDVFRRDLVNRETELASLNDAGEQAICKEQSYYCLFNMKNSINADGRYIAFHSTAVNLVPGDGNDQYDVFVRDFEKGTTKRVSTSSEGVEGNGPSTDPSVSADGSHVVFTSQSSNLVEDDMNELQDIFLAGP